MQGHIVYFGYIIIKILENMNSLAFVFRLICGFIASKVIKITFIYGRSVQSRNTECHEVQLIDIKYNEYWRNIDLIQI